MIRTVVAQDYKFLDGDQTFDLKEGSTVKLHAVSTKPMVLSAVNSDGVVHTMASGLDIDFHSRMVGWAGMLLEGKEMAVSAVISNAECEVDPTPVAFSEPPRIDPMRLAALQILREEISKRGLNQIFAEDDEVMEMLDDLENGELDFEDEEPDEYGLTAHELAEKERQRARDIAKFKEENDEVDDVDTVSEDEDDAEPLAPPDKQSVAPEAPPAKPKKAKA